MRPEARLSRRIEDHRAGRRLLAVGPSRTKGHPIIYQRMRDMVGAEAADERRTVVIRFTERRARATLPLFVAAMPIFSRAYYASRPFDESTLDVPLGSGALPGRPLRHRTLYRVRAGEGLVGRRPAGQHRHEQFR